MQIQLKELEYEITKNKKDSQDAVKRVCIKLDEDLKEGEISTQFGRLEKA